MRERETHREREGERERDKKAVEKICTPQSNL